MSTLFSASKDAIVASSLPVLISVRTLSKGRAEVPTVRAEPRADGRADGRADTRADTPGRSPMVSFASSSLFDRADFAVSRVQGGCTL